MPVPTIPYIQTTDAVVGEGHATLPDVANRPLKSVISQSGIDEATTGFIGFVPVFNVKAYGAVGNGATDDVAAFEAAITAARTRRGVVFVPFSPSSYKVSRTLILGSDVLSFVPLVGDHCIPTIEYTGATGFVLNMSGTSTSAYCNAGLVQNIQLKNALTALTDGCIKMYFTSTPRLDNVKLTTNAIGVDRNECISFLGTNVNFSSTGGSNAKWGFRGLARNFVLLGGRIYGFEVACHLNGESHVLKGTNIEFCDVIAQSAAMDSALFSGCHFEEMNLLLTNAATLPTIAAGAWTDNGSAGVGASGAIIFDGCVGLGSTNRTNLIVVKNQASFTYEVVISGGYWQNTNLKVRGSFTPGDATAIPSGSSLKLYGRSAGTFDVAIPTDAFTLLVKDSNNLVYISNISTNQFTAVSGVSGEVGRFQSGFDNAGLHICNTGTGGLDWSLQSCGGSSGYGQGTLAFVTGPGPGTVVAAKMTQTYISSKRMIGTSAAIAYSASMTPDASAGQAQTITATNATAFTINAPTNLVTDQLLTLTIRNTSGGALGVATFNAIFKMSAWTQPATGNSRSITFRYDGTNLIEIARTPADVPN
jgi:hypothetical protein